MRIVIGMTGASGAAFGVDFVRRCPGEKFLILTKWGRYVLKIGRASCRERVYVLV